MDPFASALEQAAALRRGDYSSEELTRAYLERIERLNPELNHYVLVTADLALQMARDDHRGELGGVPVSIKDLVSLAGYPTTFGSRALAGLELPYDSYVVSRLKEAGCPVLGKTNTSEFGTRTVADVAAGLDAVAGHLPGDPFWAEPDPRSRAFPLRVGFVTSAAAAVDAEVAAAVSNVARAISDLGHHVDEGGPDTAPFREPMLVIVSAGMASLPLPPDADLDPLNRLSIATGNQLTAADYLRALGAIREQSRRGGAFRADHALRVT